MCIQSTCEAFKRVDFEGEIEHLALFTRILYRLKEVGMMLELPEVGKSKGYGAQEIGRVAVTRISEDKCLVLKPSNIVDYLVQQANMTAN